ncbi:MAG: NADH-quinone oxidoreductase subunit A [Bdellovibrionales bacterium]|nr:NADH-quinone oxidoreductase subunit A [Bdellovibrionales bacterium]
MSQLLPVLLLSLFVILFGSALLFLASRIGAKGKPNSVKEETYECGIPAETSGPTKIPIKFYLTAILFILFDIEIIFMYPWALTYGDFISGGYGIYIFSAMAFFIAVFIFGLFWEVKSKALEWE